MHAEINNLYTLTIVYVSRHVTLHKKWSFPLKISSVNPQFPAGLVTFTEEILNGHFIFCAVLRATVGHTKNLTATNIIISTLVFCFKKTIADLDNKGFIDLVKRSSLHYMLQLTQN